MSATLRVLILNERDPRHPAAGGAELHVFEIFGRLAARGHSVTALCERFAGSAAHERIDGIEVRRLQRVPLYYASAARTCARESAAGHFDVVVECLNKMPFLSPLYSRVPVLALSHHLFGSTAFREVAWPIASAVWAAEKCIPAVFRRSRFVTISESSKRDLVTRGVPPEHVRVSACGIAAPRVAFDLERPRPPRIAYVGRLAHYKRVDVVLQAVARLRTRFAGLEALVIGRGPAQAGLEALARELGVADCTRFTGFVTDDERDALVASSRVCVCPSEKEGWGLTVIEANAVGTPVVAADAPGLRDSVRHAETGYLVPAGDVSGFAERISQLLADDALAARMGHSALRWSRHFDWDRAADEMEETLMELEATSAG